MRRVLLTLTIIISIALWISVTVMAEDELPKEEAANFESAVPEEIEQPSTVTISNEYIRIVVNNETENTGRFALETTGGNPDRASDDGQPLIYGRPKPWTSYTTVKIDGEDFVFGGLTTKRAGLEGSYGEVVVPPTVRGDGIESICQIGPIEVLQRLEFAISSTTGYRDSARIIYRVTNTDTVSHEVGLRIMLDTLLGANDGAPFRFNEEAILGDSRYQSDNLPEFWQAFDSLSDPRVIAQGTLVGPDVTRPDQIVFSNWGSFADGLWDIDFQPGREFIRLGEFELDSAAGLYWSPAILGPGESRTFVTAYGMGGLSISPGELSLGVTSPAQVSLDEAGMARIPVVAYLENTGEGIGRELKITLKAPNGMSFSPETPQTRLVGFLRSGRSTQASWVLLADKQLAGRTISLRVEVTGPDIDTIAVSRRLRILGPPDLEYQVTGGKKPDSDYYLIEARLANKGQSTAYNVEAALRLPTGWEFAPHERARRFLGELAPGTKPEEALTWQWQVKPVSLEASSQLTTVITSTNTEPNEKSLNLITSELTPKISIVPREESVAPGTLVEVVVKATDIKGFRGLKLTLNYNPQQAVLLDYSRGFLWVDQNGQPYEFTVQHNRGAGQVILEGKVPTESGIFTGAGEVVILKFLPLVTGSIPLKLAESPLLYSTVAEQNIDLEISPITVKE